MNKIKISAGILAGFVFVPSLAACGSGTAAVVQVPSVSAPNGTKLTEPLLEALMPAAVQNTGMTRQAFCGAIRALPDAFLTQQFMSGLAQTAGSVSIDPSIVAPAIRNYCASAV